MADISSTLKQREQFYNGIPFVDRAAFSQTLKEAFRKGALWAALPADQKEALDMIAHKLARIVCGNPAMADHWHDIAGYVQLVEEELHKAAGKPPAAPQPVFFPPSPPAPPVKQALDEIAEKAPEIPSKPAIPAAPPVPNRVPDRPPGT